MTEDNKTRSNIHLLYLRCMGMIKTIAQSYGYLKDEKKRKQLETRLGEYALDCNVASQSKNSLAIGKLFVELSDFYGERVIHEISHRRSLPIQEYKIGEFITIPVYKEQTNAK